MQRQGALADPALAGAHGHEVAHPGEPVGDAGALLGDLLEDPGPSVADDVVVALHFSSLAYTVPHQPPGREMPRTTRSGPSRRAARDPFFVSLRH